MSSDPQITVVIPVFRDAERAIATVAAIRRQSLPPGVGAEVIVVDDGSGDGSAERIATAVSGAATVIGLEANRGRSGARNAGAAVARGRSVVFVDCDCLPDRDDLLAAHHAVLGRGVVASTGHVRGCGDGSFWDRYQNDSSHRRERLFRDGLACAGSSQNLAVDVAAFRDAGGFDESYSHYGFEDRELLARMATRGRIAWVDGPGVRHMDEIRVRGFVHKIAEAGRHTGPRFGRDHPAAYARLGYARADARTNRLARLAGTVAGPLLPALAAACDFVVARNGIPHAAKASLVRVVTALAFMAGSARAPRDERPRAPGPT